MAAGAGAPSLAAQVMGETGVREQAMMGTSIESMLARQQRQAEAQIRQALRLAVRRLEQPGLSYSRAQALLRDLRAAVAFAEIAAQLAAVQVEAEAERQLPRAADSALSDD